MTSKMSHVIAGFVGGIVAVLIIFASGRLNEPGTDNALEEILAADRAFAVVGDEKGFGPAFDAYSADDITMFTQGGPINGRTKVVEALAGMGPGVVTWEPQGGVISSAGDLGYTWGTSVFRPSADAEPQNGYYVTIWRKNADGEWKVIADIGT